METENIAEKLYKYEAEKDPTMPMITIKYNGLGCTIDYDLYNEFKNAHDINIIDEIISAMEMEIKGITV
jgi:hypothetical protein